MAKDAKGHGSEKRGSVMPSRPATQSDYVQRQRDEDRVAASALAAPGHPKSAPAPVHPAQAGMSALVNTVKSAYGSAENAAWRKFHQERKIPGPHYLDPHDPRGRRK